MDKKSLIAVISEECLKHRNPNEPASRLMLIYQEKDKFNYINPYEYKEDVLSLVHPKEYINKIKNKTSYSSPDTPIGNNTYHSALYAARGAITAAEVLDEYRHAFALIRPPGHHASFSGSIIYGIPWGFCYFNNMAIATTYLLKNKKADKIAVLDMDFHYGEGTQSIFKENENVTCFSIHANTNFPPVAKIKAKNLSSFTLEEIEHNEYMKTLKNILDEIKEFKPDRIGISIGLDTHKEDIFARSLGEGLETADYIKIFEMIDELNIPSYWVLEGGYNQNVIKEVFLKILR